MLNQIIHYLVHFGSVNLPEQIQKSFQLVTTTYVDAF